MKNSFYQENRQLVRDLLETYSSEKRVYSPPAAPKPTKYRNPLKQGNAVDRGIKRLEKKIAQLPSGESAVAGKYFNQAT